MPEHRLKPLSPLGATSPVTDRFDGLLIAENTALALASIACRLGREKDLSTAAKKALGFALPEAEMAGSKGDYLAFRTGPDQWFVEAPFASHEDIAARLKTALGDAASVTEQTDGWARFDLTGPAAPVVLERLAILDTSTMASGAAARTVIEHLGCFVLCRKAGDSFSILGPRSAAVSLHHALVTAAKSAL